MPFSTPPLRIFLLLALSACALSACATAGRRDAAASPPLCSLAQLDETFVSLKSMPPEIVSDLFSRFSEVTVLSGETGMADRGEPYNATGAFGAHRRFIQGGRSGEKFILLYEHDEGEGHDHAVIYERDSDMPLHATANVVAQPRDICAVAQAVLADPADPQLWRNRRDW